MPGPGRTRSRRPLWLQLATLCFLLTTLGPFARGEPCGPNPCNLPPNLPDYFKANYGLVQSPGSRMVSCRVEQYRGGPACLFSVNGPIQPPENAGGDTPLERARSITRAILEREAGLLGIPDLAELSEKEPRLRESGIIGISYERRIGGVPLAYMHLDFAFKADGTLYKWHATLVPVPPELYEAVKRERLSADQIKAIVARDLGWPVQHEAPPAGERAPEGTGRPPELRLTDAEIRAMQERGVAAPPLQQPPVIDEPTLMAVSEPPYLHWGVTGRQAAFKAAWAYGIDAFSGEILSRNCTARTLVPSPQGRTPCD